MANTFPAKEYPKSIFQQTTPDETQNLRNTPRFNTIYKGALTKSEIYERMYPDGQTGALRIDGPQDAFVSFPTNGSIIISTGKKNIEQGPGSGKLCIHSHGQQQKHEQRTDIEYNCGEDSDEALNIIAYGDIVEEAYGSERHIKAQKIIITAEEELFLIGKTEVKIQAGANGGGAIQMYAGSVEKVTNNDKEVVSGQKMTYGAGEETSIQFDPRASKNIISPGHINHKVLGDYKTWIGGVSQTVVAGGTPAPPLVKARDNSYSVNSLVGGTSVKSATSVSIDAGAQFSANAAAAIDLTAGEGVDIYGGANVSITSAANVDIKGVLILLN